VSEDHGQEPGHGSNSHGPGGERPGGGPLTLGLDIGGTGLKASVLDAAGAMVAERVREDTPYPLRPEQLVEELAHLADELPRADRASAGFPGMVRQGVVLSAPHFVRTGGPGTPVDPDLARAWDHFDLAQALAKRLGVPTKVANDADVQGAAVVRGQGLELVVTLGTGFGTALFFEGRLLPHLEVAQIPFRKGETYTEHLGEHARETVGTKKWRKRVRKALAAMRTLTLFDHCYVGGGNAAHLEEEDLGPDVTLVDNSAGITGGVRLWEADHLGL
jgi:polyphosphate glucokinase